LSRLEELDELLVDCSGFGRRKATIPLKEWEGRGGRENGFSVRFGEGRGKGKRREEKRKRTRRKLRLRTRIGADEGNLRGILYGAVVEGMVEARSQN